MASPPAGKKPAAPQNTKKPTARNKAVGSTVSESHPLEPRQERFVAEYLVDLNATQAAVRAGYSAKTARQMGAQNLSKPSIQAAIIAGQSERSKRTEINSDAALKEAWAIAIADARELVQVKVGCCRSCHGEGNQRQRTVAEMNRDREKHIDAGKSVSEFDEEGGIGFNPLLPPNPVCPQCGGDGQARTVLMDTRYLSPQAAALYAGAKEGKHGIEVQMHDKLAAMEKVFKHLGLYEKDNKQKVDPLTSLLHTIAGGNNNGFKPVANDPEH